MFGVLTSIALMTATRTAIACMVMESKQEVIEISMTPTRKVPLQVVSYENRGEPGLETECYASISLPLSLFPTARLASRPADFASNLREVAEKWNVSRCSVSVWLVNDTGDDVRQKDMCRIEEFRYDGDSVWSGGSEKACSDEFVV